MKPNLMSHRSNNASSPRPSNVSVPFPYSDGHNAGRVAVRPSGPNERPTRRRPSVADGEEVRF